MSKKISNITGASQNNDCMNKISQTPPTVITIHPHKIHPQTNIHNNKSGKFQSPMRFHWIEQLPSAYIVEVYHLSNII